MIHIESIGHPDIQSLDVTCLDIIEAITCHYVTVSRVVELGRADAVYGCCC